MSALTRLREWIAFKIAPWVYVPYREAREDAFRELAHVAYGSRDAVWASPMTLVKTALAHEYDRGTRAKP